MAKPNVSVASWPSSKGSSVPHERALLQIQENLLERLQRVEMERLRAKLAISKASLGRELSKRSRRHPLLMGKAYFPHLVPSRFARFQALSTGLQIRERRLAMALPRDHGKTTLNSTVVPLWRIARADVPELLLIGSSDPMAEIFFRRWKDELQSNEAFQRDFGVRPGKKWGADEIDVIVRPPGTSHETTVRAYCRGQGCKMRGFHPGYLYAEDIEDEMDMESTAVRKKFFDWWWRVVGGMVRPDDMWHIVGTIVHPLSLMAELTAVPGRNLATGWYALRLPAIVHALLPNGRRERRALWPQHRSLDWLDAKLRDLGTDPFAKEYMNDVAVYQRGGFQHRHLLYYDEYPQREKMLVSLTMDPSDGIECPWAITVRGVLANGDWLCLEAVEELSGPADMIAAFFSVLDRWRPNRVGVEQVAGAKLLSSYTLPEEAKQRGVDYLPDIEKVGGGTNTTKEGRCRQLLPLYERKAVRMRRDQVCLRDGLLRFPKRPIDVVDSWAMHLDFPDSGQRPDAHAPPPAEEAPPGSFQDAVNVSRQRLEDDVRPLMRL